MRLKNIDNTEYAQEVYGARFLPTRLVPGGVLVVGAQEKLPKGGHGFEPWLPEDTSQESAGALRCFWRRR